VLVNEGTASASEILTGALKDSYGVTIVGEKTYGKGKVQQVKNLSDGSMVKYTTAKWLRPNGECVDGEGIKPDYEVEIEVVDENTIVDTQLKKAIEVLVN
jgi:carboxyl-terminal processing protease